MAGGEELACIETGHQDHRLNFLGPSSYWGRWGRGGGGLGGMKACISGCERSYNL